MEDLRKWVPVFGLILVALIFSIVAVYMPWWDIKTTKGAEIVQDSTAKAEYTLFQTVTACVTSDNKSVTMSFMNLSDGEAEKEALVSVFNTSFLCTIAGICMTFLTLVFILISGLRKSLFRFTAITGAVAGILLLIAILNLTFLLPPIIEELGEVMPLETPTSWVRLEPERIGGFWGWLPIPEGSEFPEWSWNTPFWEWGAAFGWYTGFVASLLLFASSTWIYKISPKK